MADFQDNKYQSHKNSDQPSNLNNNPLKVVSNVNLPSQNNAQHPLVQSHVVPQPVQYVQNAVLASQPAVLAPQTTLHASTVQYVQQPAVQYVTQPVVQQQVQYVQQQQQQAGQWIFQGSVLTGQQREVVRGESRIEYVPYEKSLIEYEAVQRTEYIPKEKRVTDYYAIEYQVEYIPQVYQDRYIEYIPQERVQERIEYQAIEKQIVHQPVQEVQQSQVVVQQVPVVQQQYVTQQVVSQPVVTTQVVQQPVTTQVVQQPVTTQVVQQPVTTSQVVHQPLLTHSYAYAQPGVQWVNSGVVPGALYAGQQVTQVLPAGSNRVLVSPEKKKEKGFLEKIFE